MKYTWASASDVGHARDQNQDALAPADDILGLPRGTSPDLGAFELGSIFGDGFESGDTAAWSSASGMASYAKGLSGEETSAKRYAQPPPPREAFSAS